MTIMTAINVTRRAVAVAPATEDDPWAAIGEQSLAGLDADALKKTADVARVLHAPAPVAPRVRPQRSQASKLGELPDLGREGFGFRGEAARRPHLHVEDAEGAPARPMLARTVIATACFGAAMGVGSWLRSEQHNPVQGAIVVAFGAVVALMVWLSGR
jgi:hypothetical protein